MTDEELKAIVERTGAATWWHESECDVQVVYDDGDEHHEEPIYVALKGATIGETFIQLTHGYDNDGADWNFIAHARADIPALIAEVRRLQGVAARARDEALDAIAEKCREVVGTEPLSFIGDPYRRGCIDTANVIEEGVRALKGRA